VTVARRKIERPLRVWDIRKALLVVAALMSTAPADAKTASTTSVPIRLHGTEASASTTRRSLSTSSSGECRMLVFHAKFFEIGSFLIRLPVAA
jgi:hypothetical protein